MCCLANEVQGTVIRITHWNALISSCVHIWGSCYTRLIEFVYTVHAYCLKHYVNLYNINLISNCTSASLFNACHTPHTHTHYTPQGVCSVLSNSWRVVDLLGTGQESVLGASTRL